jgi:hypothetical protein
MFRHCLYLKNSFTIKRFCIVSERNVTPKTLGARRLDLPYLPPTLPLIASSLWTLGHGDAVDHGPRRLEGSTPTFEGFVLYCRVKLCRGSAQVMVAAPRAIRSPRLQPHLGANIERLVGVVWSSRISSGCGDLRIVKHYKKYVSL